MKKSLNRLTIVSFVTLSFVFMVPFLFVLPANGQALEPGADLQGLDFRGADWNNIDLTGANLENADLTDANLTDVRLENANLGNAILVNASLNCSLCC